MDLEVGEPYARVQRHGRWAYYVTVHHGITQWGPDGAGWFRLGRKRAERKAERALRAYRRHMARRADVTHIGGGPTPKPASPPSCPSGVSPGPEGRA